MSFTACYIEHVLHKELLHWRCVLDLSLVACKAARIIVCAYCPSQYLLNEYHTQSYMEDILLMPIYIHCVVPIYSELLHCGSANVHVYVN